MSTKWPTNFYPFNIGPCVVCGKESRLQIPNEINTRIIHENPDGTILCMQQEIKGCVWVLVCNEHYWTYPVKVNKSQGLLDWEAKEEAKKNAGTG